MDDPPQEPAPIGNDYVKPGAAARMLHVTTRTINRWSKQGRIPFVTTAGGHRRFHRADIEAIVRQMSTRTRPPPEITTDSFDG